MTEKTKNEKKNSIWKILENNDFHCDKFFNFLPKDIWNFIFSLLQKEDITKLLFVSKSFYQFLNLNSHNCWKTIEFRNYLTDKKSDQEIFSILSFPRFSQLTELKFISYKFTKDILTNILKTQKYLSVLSLQYCPLEDKKLQIIIDWMKFNLSLKKLKFYCNSISSKGIRNLCDGFQVTPSLKVFDFVEYSGKKKITEEEIITIAEFLKTNSSLESLLLDYVTTIEGLRILSESLVINKTLKTFTIRAIGIGDEGIKYITEALKINKTLLYLDIWGGFGIGDKGATYIIEALKINTTLKLFVLTDNKVSHRVRNILQQVEFKGRILL